MPRVLAAGPRRRKRCFGCNELRRATALRSGRAGEKRCSACAKAAAKAKTTLPAWCVCSSCGGGPVRCIEGACVACRRVSALEHGGIGSTRLGAERGDVEALAGLHLADWSYVTVWILALTPECLLILIRLVLWCKFGCLAGLFLAVDVQSWSHGVRTLNLVLLADHLHGVFVQGKWPPGNAPVLVTGIAQSDLGALVALMAQRGVPVAARLRLRALPCSLSERGATKGFRTKAFVAAPSRVEWRDKKIVQRAKLAHDAAGRPGGRCRKITEATDEGAAFRRLLFPPADSAS